MTKKVKLIIGTTATVAIAVGVALALYLLFRTTETHTTTVETKTETSILTCQAMAASGDSFFDTKNALNVEQKIKMTFTEGVPNKLNYLYEGSYASVETADKASNLLHADYNIYMADKAESLTPNFSVIDNELKINLFADKSQMNAKVGRLFFLSSDEATNFTSYKDEDLMRLYQNKGFSCKLETK